MKNALIKNTGFIGGRWVPSPPSSSSSSSSAAAAAAETTTTFDVLNPATGNVVATLPRMGATDANSAIAAAHGAWGKWRSTLASDRAKILRNLADLMGKHTDDLARIITLENGKPLPEAKGEVAYAKSFLDLYAEEATRVHGEVMATAFRNQRMLTIKQAVGPAALITPFNFPSAMVTRKMGPALAAGCTVVIKPSEETPLSALALCALAEEAGVPAGVVNCLTVGRDEVQDVGHALCHSQLLRKLSFTGSTDVGKWLLRESASTVKRVSMELGGNAPFIVFDDADLTEAVKALMATKFRNAGQVPLFVLFSPPSFFFIFSIHFNPALLRHRPASHRTVSWCKRGYTTRSQRPWLPRWDGWWWAMGWRPGRASGR
jgi:succinate-semialdehyde dehydrogenase/glutarate-semialdehyde dehydrogenase